MNPDGTEADGSRYKDAVFISPHKFIGGPQHAGRARREAQPAQEHACRRARAAAPSRTSTAASTATCDDPVHREEGGTPAIIESIRAGLVFQLKEAVGADAIREREVDFIQRAIASWSDEPEHRRSSATRRRGGSRSCRSSSATATAYLHHNFVVALLNDLFGIQARGGCWCAGPYGHRLLGIDVETSKEFEREILRGCEGIKPGWVRVNFNYFLSETVFAFLIEAVQFIATHGYKLLPHYRLDLATGQWHPRRTRPSPAVRLHDLSYRSGKLEYRALQRTEPEWGLGGYLKEAERIVADAEREYLVTTPETDEPLPEEAERLRWFPLPAEILAEFRGTPGRRPFGLGTRRARRFSWEGARRENDGPTDAASKSNIRVMRAAAVLGGE